MEVLSEAEEELKIMAISPKCPYCGWWHRNAAYEEGKPMVCEACGYTFVPDWSPEVLKRREKRFKELVKHIIEMQDSLTAKLMAQFSTVLEPYASRVLSAVTSVRTSMDRLPTKEELDARLRHVEEVIEETIRKELQRQIEQLGKDHDEIISKLKDMEDKVRKILELLLKLFEKRPETLHSLLISLRELPPFYERPKLPHVTLVLYREVWRDGKPVHEPDKRIHIGSYVEIGRRGRWNVVMRWPDGREELLTWSDGRPVEDAYMSRRHAIIRVVPEGAVLEVLSERKSNTRLNGKIVPPHSKVRLSDRDELELGITKFTVMIEPGD